MTQIQLLTVTGVLGRLWEKSPRVLGRGEVGSMGHCARAVRPMLCNALCSPPDRSVRTLGRASQRALQISGEKVLPAGDTVALGANASVLAGHEPMRRAGTLPPWGCGLRRSVPPRPPRPLEPPRPQPLLPLLPGRPGPGSGVLFLTLLLGPPPQPLTFPAWGQFRFLPCRARTCPVRQLKLL